MARGLSKYERSWRERAGHVPRPSPSVAPRPAAPPQSLVGGSGIPAEPPRVDPPVSAPAPVLPTASVAGDPVLALEFKGSSNVRSAKLDAATGIVEVEFKGEKRYRYSGFTPELMAEWQAAPSAGSWLHDNVKSKPDRHPLVLDASPPPGR